MIAVLDNMRRGLNASIEVLKMGHSPFVPWLDYQFSLMSDGLTIEHYYRYSMAWLEVSDAALFLEGWEKSHGATAEHKRAQELGIKIYYAIEEIPKP